MIRLAAWYLAAVLVLAVVSVALAQYEYPYAPDRIIVKYRTTARSRGPLPLPAGASVAVDRRFRSGAQLLRIGGMTVEQAVALYTSDPHVEYAEPDYKVTIDQTVGNLPDDPRLAELYGLNNTGQTGGAADADIDAAEAWTIQTGGDILIGVIDTGIDWRHEDLAANIWVNPGEIPANGIDDDGNGFVDDIHGWDFVHGDNDPMDDNGHGTHVSGTIAAVGNNGIGVAGVCWKARLMAIKTLDSNGSGSTSMVIAGIEYATLMGARLTNNSWGTPAYSRALDEALAAVEETNALFVAAAGNSGRSNDLIPHYPSSYEYDHVIAVASSDHSDLLSATSNYGVEAVDLSAPGEAVLSLGLGDTYKVLSGTSMATPHVSGVIGLMLSEAPLMTPQQTKRLLLNTVDPIPSMHGRVVSRGRLNAYSALAGLDATPPGRIDDLKVAETGSNTVTLMWTASGDDAGEGTAAVYDLRYADTPIKPSTFGRAIRVEQCPPPRVAGTRESFRVDGLDVKTTYFFAMKVLDERLNASELSKMAAARTQGVPEVRYAPERFDGVALSGATVMGTMRITNSGKGTIDFAFAPGTPGWVFVEPRAGTVAARGTADVAVMFDALGLPGGDYDDVVAMMTNDPATPTIELPVHLLVTSAPHLVVSEMAVDFGAWFVGASARREIRAVNRGDRTLTVSGVEVVAADGVTDFGADPEPFTLPPSGERAIMIDFAPTGPRLATASLHVISDDPDDPVVGVTLTGRGLPPPDIHVLPIRVATALHSGAVSVDTVTIVNEGTSDLYWNLSIDTNSGPPDPDRGAGDEGPFRNLAGVRVLYDAAHRNLHWFNYNTMFLDLRNRGAEVVVSESEFTPEYLDGFDIVWMADAFSPLGPEEQNALVAWVRAGGGLLLEGDYDESVTVFNGILGALLSGIEMSLEDGTTGVTHIVEEHETTRGVDNVFLSFVKATLLAVRPPASPLIYDIDNVRNSAWSRAGAGRLFVMADQNLANHRMGEAGNQILGNRIIDWLALGVSWLRTSPPSGVLAPSESQTLEVSVDATGLGGPFDAFVLVRSNDPDEPAVPVFVHLDATPAPDIVLSTSRIRLPPTAVTDSSQYDVTVGNIGLTDIEVTGVSSSDANFTAAPAAFTVPPGDIVTLTITYAPMAAGEDSAVVTLESNDPDEGATTIAVSGEAVTERPDTTTAAAAMTFALTTRLPERTALHQNVPNPFNPTTTIAYDVRDTGPVKIVIYNVRGQVVRTLVDQATFPGSYAVTWQGRSDSGAPVATGVYFCRLVAGAFTQTRKMVLLQ